MANNEEKFGFTPDEADPFDFVPETEEKSEEDETTTTEALTRGVEEGITFGFADELAGAVGAAIEATGSTKPSKEDIIAQLSPETREKVEKYDIEIPEFKQKKDLLDTYQEYRDIARQKYEKAREEAPAAYTAGTLAGGFLVPGGIAARSTKAARSTIPSLAKQMVSGAKTGAGAGAVAGAGISEAELAEGEVGELAEDIATGAGFGAAFGGALPPTATAGKKIGEDVAYAGKAAGEFLFGRPVRAFKEGLKGRRLFGEEASKQLGQEITERGKQIGQQLQERLNYLAQLKGRIMSRAKKQGVKLDEERVDEYLRKQMGIEPKSVLPQAQREATELGEMARTAKEGRLVRQTRKEARPTGKQKVAEIEELKRAEQEAIESGVNPEDIETVFEPTDIQGKQAAVVRQKIKHPETEEVQGYKKLASRLIDEEDLGPQFRETTEKVRKYPKDITDVEQAEQFRKDIKAKTKYGDFPFKTQEIQKEAVRAQEELRDMLREKMPYLKPTDEAISAVNRAAETLGIDNLRTADPYKMMNKFVQLVEGTESTRAAGAKARQLSRDFIDALEAGDAKMADRISKEIQDFADITEIRQIMGKSIKPVLAPFETTRTIATGAGAGAGYTGFKVGEAAKQAGKLLPEKLQQMAVRAAKTGGRAGQDLASELARAATQDQRGRNAILFSVMQNPKYRELFREIQQPDEENEQ